MEPNRLYTISEMLKVLPSCAELTNQKVTRLVADLVKVNAIVRTEDKRKAYFSLA
jgi:predicted transcriptional regulator